MTALPRVREAVARIDRECTMDLRCVVIGHTHGARVVVYKTGTEFLTPVDAGAWIQDARNTDGTEEGTFAALCGNEVRLFRLAN